VVAEDRGEYFYGENHFILAVVDELARYFNGGKRKFCTCTCGSRAVGACHIPTLILKPLNFMQPENIKGCKSN